MYDLESVRRQNLNSLSKEEVIGIYLRGVRQADGSRICSAGPASALRKWRKGEIVNSLLDIGWPGVWPGASE